VADFERAVKKPILDERDRRKLGDVTRFSEGSACDDPAPVNLRARSSMARIIRGDSASP
jgi:hypothetical protein